jgi:probable phosphoglycerate mutase
MNENKSLILLMRHGQIPQFSPRRYIGKQDFPLDETGLDQARKTGRYLAELNIDRVFCSNLLRTRQTAELARPDFKSKITQIDELQEIDLGLWEGLTKQQVMADYPSEYEERGLNMGSYRTPEGESFADVQQRALNAFHKIAEIGGTSLVVAHGGVNRTILCHLLGMDLNNLFKIDQQYCGINLISKTSKGYTVHSVNWRAPELAFTSD